MENPLVPRAARRVITGAFRFALSLVLALPAAAANRGAIPPVGGGLNILLVTIDTLRADRLSCLNPASVPTPFIDGLADSGTVFTRAFAHTPLTLPSHASLLLGKTPPSHGVHDNGRFVVQDEFLTLAELLKAQGYATGAFVGGYPLHSRFGLNQGFDVYDDRFPADPGIGREFAESRAGAVADKALTWLKGQRTPWFLWVHFYDPHDPYEPPEPFRTRFGNAPYDGEVAYTDETAGRLFAFLRNNGLSDATMVVLTGDHGESLGEHGELTHGFLAYNSTLWIPLIVSVPGEKPSRTDAAVSHIDVFPTVCEALSIEKPAGLEGRSLFPAMRGREAPPRPIYFECLSPYFGRGWAPIRGLIDDGLKFVESPIPELYDLEKDFDETANLAGSRDLAGFRRALDKLAGPFAGGSQAESRLDAAAVERLRSLGYAAGPARARTTKFSPADDVKTLLPFHQKSMEALALSREGREADAVRSLRDIIEARPDLDAARVNLALIHEAGGRTDEARKVLLDGLESLPESYDLYTHLFRLDLATGDYARAVALVESYAHPQMRTDTRIWVDLGLAYRNLKDFPKALAAYETAAAIDPTYPVVHNNLGTLHLAMHLEKPDRAVLDKARGHFQKAADLDPAYAGALYGLGRAHYHAGSLDPAVAALRRAVALDPDMTDALFYLGMSLYHKGLRSEALSPLENYRARAASRLPAADLERLDGIIAECRAKR